MFRNELLFIGYELSIDVVLLQPVVVAVRLERHQRSLKGCPVDSDLRAYTIAPEGELCICVCLQVTVAPVEPVGWLVAREMLIPRWYCLQSPTAGQCLSRRKSSLGVESQLLWHLLCSNGDCSCINHFLFTESQRPAQLYFGFGNLYTFTYL